jgi:DNA polymerase-3 subunit beta
MKIIILKEKLKQGLSIVERISGKSLNLPILNNILIKSEKNFLNLASTDLEIGVNWWSLAKIEKEGKITVPGRIFTSFINSLPNKPISLTLKNLNLEIDCENYHTSLKGIDAEEFPIIPKISKTEKISVQSKVFCQGLLQVVDIAGSFSIKPEISGIYFLFQKNLITITATDSFRLGEKKIYLNSSLVDISQNYSFILPQRTAKEIINIFQEKEEDLTIYFSPNQALFELPLSETPHSPPQIQLTSRLIEGEYPNYQEIIPQKKETQIVFPVDELINQIKSASIFSGKINEIKLKTDPLKNQLIIISQDSNIGEYKSFLNVKIKGSSYEISFNYKFLLEGLLNIVLSCGKNSEAILNLNGSEKPAVLQPVNNESYLYLIMPIKNI